MLTFTSVATFKCNMAITHKFLSSKRLVSFEYQTLPILATSQVVKLDLILNKYSLYGEPCHGEFIVYRLLIVHMVRSHIMMIL